MPPDDTRQSGAQHLISAAEKRRRGDADGALADCSRAVELDPALGEAYALRAEILSERGEVQGAIANYGMAIRLDFDAARCHLNRGSLYEIAGDYEAALSDYSKAIELDGALMPARLKRADLYYKLGDADRCLSDLTAAIKHDPTSAPAHNNRGMMLHLLHDYEGAIADSTRAIEIDPAYAAAYFTRGNAQMNSGNRDAAMTDLARAVTYDPRCVDAYYNMAVTYTELNDLFMANVLYSAVIGLDDRHFLAYCNRGRGRHQSGDIEGAFADYPKALEIYPFTLVYNNLATIYQARSDVDSALHNYALAIESDPTFVLPLLNRGNLYHDLQRYDEAVADFSKVLSLEAENPRAYHRRGLSRIALGDSEGGAADLRRAEELNPAQVDLEDQGLIA